MVGRAATCAIRLTSPSVSGEHAIFLWREDGWHVRDLGSRNGTWIDGARLAPGTRRAIDVGTTVHLGSGDGDARLTLVDDGRPALRAVCEATGEIAIGEDLLQIGDESDPGWTIYDDGGTWIAETDGSPIEIHDQHVLVHGGQRWVVEIAPRAPGDPIESTDSVVPAACPLELYAFRFDVSRDEESVRLGLYRRDAPGPVDLDAPPDLELPDRTAHYLLVTLARKRLTDREAGVPQAEEGWVYIDELTQMLAFTKPRINLEIFRLRKLLTANRVAGAGRIVERRAGSGQLRIGVADVRVIDGRSATTR